MKKKLNLILPCFVLLLLIVIIFLLNNYYYITILTFPEKIVVFKEKISPGQRIALAYTHSVAQTPVWEFFEIDKEGKLILTETHFHDHGAGLPYTAFDEEIFICEDHKFKIKNMQREIILPLYYRIYKDRGNVFIFENQEIRLSDTVGDALLVIDIYHKSINDSLLKYFMNLGGIKSDE